MAVGLLARFRGLVIGDLVLRCPANGFQSLGEDGVGVVVRRVQPVGILVVDQ